MAGNLSARFTVCPNRRLFAPEGAVRHNSCMVVFHEAPVARDGRAIGEKQMTRKFAVSALAALAFAAAPATAVVYDVASSFDGVNNPAGPFTFGYVDAGLTSFTPFAASGFASGCLGNSALTCITGGGQPALGAYKNTSASAQNNVVGTINVPGDALFLHPGTSLLSAITFTAPTSALYNYSVSVNLLTNQNPTGVDLFTGNFFGGPLNGFLTASLPANLGASYAFAGGINLSAGDTIFLAIGPAGDYRYDSTQVSWTMAAVPEPVTWTMMIAGFGLVGIAARRRSVAIAA